jgi:hypothetical protein
MNIEYRNIEYLEFCENIFKEWKIHQFKDEIGLSELFEMDYSPEPYFTLKKGDKKLFLLLTNPGSGMEFQHISKRNESSYKEFEIKLTEIYTSESFKNGIGSRIAFRRLLNSMTFAEILGYNSVINIETIPFHSNNLHKSKALIAINKSKLLKCYERSLKDFLLNKAILIVSACNSKKSISKSTLLESEWLMYQLDIAGINFEKLILTPLTTKGNKISSAMFSEGNKHIVLMMGSNNLPSLKYSFQLLSKYSSM